MNKNFKTFSIVFLIMISSISCAFLYMQKYNKKSSVPVLEYENYKCTTTNLDKIVKNTSKDKNKKVIRYGNNIRYSRGSVSYNTDFYNEHIKNQNATKASKTIELLDWNTAKNIFKRDSKARVIDVYTHKSFNVQRTMGDNHADTEALTKKDTKIIKEIWNGFSWTRRPVIVEVNGRYLAASMSAMPHAGLDNKPAFVTVANRSSGYGTGANLDVIKDNDMDGHFDIHFLNSTRHMDGRKDPQHQNAIQIASKVKE
ncbi:hypothetical protein Z968_03355 [Clostridium novyi A str. 4552]|uniref:Lipoprotein n=1 Tax=Clostridium novyi A str. 4552 TaxID=1444289 RepID=A0A0A0IAT7_CLONO|nr:hypothetical protein [Clostridium novyi]KGM97441.1 hypothetical protein Z968_03355 [Clostridium novyi A str. 4552]